MSKHARIPASDDAWDEGLLGLDEAHVKKFEGNIEALVDDALELQPISIRLQKGLLDNLKLIAKMNGMGYQPMVRQVLRRFVDAEIKKILRERERELEEHKQEIAAKKAAPPAHRKAA